MPYINIKSISGFYIAQLGLSVAGRIYTESNKIKRESLRDPAYDPGFNPQDVRQELVKMSTTTGAYIYDNLVLTMPGHTDPVTGEYVEELTLDFDHLTLRVSPEQNIIKVPLSSQNGTMKTITGYGDYKITCEGILLSETADLPLDLVRYFDTLRKSKVRLAVESRLINEGFNVDGAMIDGSPQVSQIKGTPNAYDITFELVSDFDFEIDIN